MKKILISIILSIFIFKTTIDNIDKSILVKQSDINILKSIIDIHNYNLYTNNINNNKQYLEIKNIVVNKNISNIFDDKQLTNLNFIITKLNKLENSYYPLDKDIRKNIIIIAYAESSFGKKINNNVAYGIFQFKPSTALEIFNKYKDKHILLYKYKHLTFNTNTIKNYLLHNNDFSLKLAIVYLEHLKTMYKHDYLWKYNGSKSYISYLKRKEQELKQYGIKIF